MKQKKVAIIGDSFVDRYCEGSVDRISPEAPVPVLNAHKWFSLGGGAINVANNLMALGLRPTLFTITDMQLPYEVVSPKDAKPLYKTRFVCNKHQLLRVDEPDRYLQQDIQRIERPSFNDFDIIAFADYDKGIINGGQATIVDTKKKDLSVFEGSAFLKINQKEFEESKNHKAFKSMFITKGEGGIDYYHNGNKLLNSPARAKDVIDVTGAGDTVMAAIIYCLATGVEKTSHIMKIANKAAGIVVSKFGTSVANYEELFGKNS